MPQPTTVAGYITATPLKARVMLKQLRGIVTSVAPKATEKISYGMPYYGYHGRLAYFAAFKDHVSFFVMGRAQKKFAQEMKPYKTSMATLQFPIGTKIPMSLIKKIVRDRVREIEEKL